MGFNTRDSYLVRWVNIIKTIFGMFWRDCKNRPGTGQDRNVMMTINGEIWTIIFSYLPPQDFSNLLMLNSETCRLHWRVLLDAHFPDEHYASTRPDTMKELTSFNANDLAREDYICCYSMSFIHHQLLTKQSALVTEARKCAHHTGEKRAHYMNDIFSWSCCGRYENEGEFESSTKVDMNTVGCVIHPRQAGRLATLQKQHSEIQERVNTLPHPFVKCLKCLQDHRTRDCSYLYYNI